jgi:23S rRNA pseudouridine1911/1915/1917 synthase
LSEDSLCLKVEENDRPIRIDKYLQSKLPQYSRAYLQKLIDRGYVTINGQSKKRSFLLRGSEEIQIVIPPPEKIMLQPLDIPLDILYEDDYLLVLNKPAGLVVHPGAGHLDGTLVNALLYHCKSLSAIGGVLRPGIVHRLDKGTSGLMVVAKEDETHRGLAEQFKNREVSKSYLTLVWGLPKEKEGEICIPIGRDHKDRKKISAISSRTKEATTFYKVREFLSEISLVEAQPKTGRTHQIRVHLAYIHHPVVGDKIYGKGRGKDLKDEKLKDYINRLKRPALHSFKLGFVHPKNNEYMEFQQSLPQDMQDISDYLKSKRL